MSRIVTLFTGQWADISIHDLIPKAAEMGFDGLELACWGDHFDVERAATDPGYSQRLWAELEQHGLTVCAISNHLVGQAVCDRIDERHRAILPDEIWGDGHPEGVKWRAAERMKSTARAARAFFNAKPASLKSTGHPPVVNGFTGSPIWHAVYPFPPTSQEYLNRGYQEFAGRWKPILDEFEAQNVNFALEVHPGEIAFDIATAQRSLDALDGHRRFGFNFDPSHLGYQGVDYVRFIRTFANRIFHCHIKDVWWGYGDGTVGVFGGHADFGDARRYWDFRSPGHGDINFEEVIVALNDTGYSGPLSVEWEDVRMDRVYGATEAADFVRSMDFPPSKTAFESAFEKR